MSSSEPWIAVSKFHQLVDVPGETMRRALRFTGVPVRKDDEGRLLVRRSDAKFVLNEAVRRGGVRRSPKA